MVDTDEASPLFIGGGRTNEVLEQYQILADDFVEDVMNGRRIKNSSSQRRLTACISKK